jgi:hypothetical protein
MDFTTFPRSASAYSVVVTPIGSNKRGGTEYVSFGSVFNLTKRAAGQLTRSLAKVDTRYKSARVLKNTTVRKAGLL